MAIKKINALLKLFGLDLAKGFNSTKGLIPFIKDYRQIKKSQKESDEQFPFGRFLPCLIDRYDQAGTASGHYFHQDLLVAQRIFKNNPEQHIDIGSRIDGFVAHVASYREIVVYDIRKIEKNLKNITFDQADLMSDLDESFIGSTDSLSCLHTIEHFGLGRYGDEINFDGHLLGLDNLSKIVKQGGKLYFSTPIGSQRIEFNGHRIFSVGYLREYFREKFELDQFSYVDDAGDLYENVEITDEDVERNYGCHLGCGIFELTKL